MRQPAYPCIERSGIIWAYMGPGEPPPFPGLDCFTAPDSHVFAFKGLWSCNWLQALEVGIDPGHASFLHRFFEDEDPSSDANYGRQFRAATIGADIPMTRLMREVPNPRLDSEETAYGLRITTQRPINDSVVHLRITNMVFPHAFVIPLSREMSITQWHVPVDDTHCYWYAIFTSFTRTGRQGNHAGATTAEPLAAGLRAARGPVERLGLRSGGTAQRDLYRHGHGHQRA